MKIVQPPAPFSRELTTENVADQKYTMHRRSFLKMTGTAAGAIMLSRMFGGVGSASAMGMGSMDILQGSLDPATVPKFVSPLAVPPVLVPDSGDDHYKISMVQAEQQMLPAGYNQTTVWCYSGKVKDPATGKTTRFTGTPAAAFVVQRNKPIWVQWINNITTPHLFAVDPTIHWANPNNLPTPQPPYHDFPPGYTDRQSPVPLVTHLHGGEVSSFYDGGPLAWFTAGLKKKGKDFTTNQFKYDNGQPPTLLWYHDHALGLTRENVYAGLAGPYIIVDPKDKVAPLLPQGKYDVPLVIQDREFNEDGSLHFPNQGNVPTVHPYWVPEFFGRFIIVNGQTWPYLNVDKGQYILRVLNGCNARFLTLRFVNDTTGANLSFTVIGVEGGYLQHAVNSTSPDNSITLAPAERAFILIDFRSIPAGTRVTLTNSAPAPFPSGDAPDANNSLIMQFRVGSKIGWRARTLPESLNPTLPCGKFPTLPLPGGSTIRQLTLNEKLIPDPTDPTVLQSIGIFLNGLMFDANITEKPKIGSTEDWMFINMTGDAHPMHIHLVQFQVVSRQAFRLEDDPMNPNPNLRLGYRTAWNAANPGGEANMPYMKTNIPNVTPYLTGPVSSPEPFEIGWKDTVKSYPVDGIHPYGVTRVRVRFKSLDGKPYPFDATKGPGYVWHCHIVDHEDNEMMRPFIVTK